jgi:hypothetical protein
MRVRDGRTWPLRAMQAELRRKVRQSVLQAGRVLRFEATKPVLQEIRRRVLRARHPGHGGEGHRRQVLRARVELLRERKAIDLLSLDRQLLRGSVLPSRQEVHRRRLRLPEEHETMRPRLL